MTLIAPVNSCFVRSVRACALGRRTQLRNGQSALWIGAQQPKLKPRGCGPSCIIAPHANLILILITPAIHEDVSAIIVSLLKMAVTRSKFVKVIVESIVTKHRVIFIKLRTLEPLEVLRYDPLLQAPCIYKEVEKIGSHKR